MTVLLMVVDDLTVRLGCYGYDVKTPNIDRLARAGRRFERAYRQYPSAVASRTSLLTGWRPERTRVWNERDLGREGLDKAVPLQRPFKAAGYFTARVGRAFGGALEKPADWDVADDAAGAGGEAETDQPDRRAALRVAQLLEERRDRSAFVVTVLGGIRAGWVAPARFQAMYPPERVKLPDSPANGWGKLPAIAISPTDRMARPGRTARPDTEPEERRRQALAAYYAYVSFIDAQVGVILDAIDRQKLWDSTVVALVGAHGSYMGGHGTLTRTDALFEETLRAPLVIASPGLPQPGVATHRFAELVDVYPTLLEVAGLPRAVAVEGTSLAPLLADPEQGVKSAAFSVAARAAGRIGRSVRTDRYRYNEWPDGSEELYDHEADPNEHTNLALSPAHAQTIAEMARLLDARYESLGARPAVEMTPAAPKPGRTPNVLLVVFDDMNVQLGCYGYDVKTPNIDRLAGMGRRFDRAYCQASICSPSRTSLMSGWNPERLGIWDNLEPPRKHLEGAVPLQDLFKKNGYFTAHVGKIYHGPFDKDFRWDVSEHDPGTPDDQDDDEEQPGPRRRPRKKGKGIASFWTATDSRDEDEPDGRRARRVARLLEEHKDGPFFIAAGFAKPHLRWVVPRKYFDMYPSDQVELPPEPEDDWKDIPAIAVEYESLDRPRLFLTGRTEPDDRLRKQAVAAYYAAVSFADAQLGVVLDALDRLKLWDDTIVVVIGDHGFHLGEHGGLWRKDTLFEETVRAPLVIAAPGLGKPGTATTQLAEFLDLYPTLVELTGLPKPPGLDGTSLAPLLRDPDHAVKAAAFSFRRCRPPQLGTSVRTERYRYTEWPDGSEELYDHEADPNELQDLARSPEHAKALAEMRKLLDAGPPEPAAPAPGGTGRR